MPLVVRRYKAGPERGGAVIPEYVGQKYYDLVTLILIGTYVNGNPYYDEYEDIAGDGDGLRLIPNGPNGDIAKLEGGTLRIYNAVADLQTCRIFDDNGTADFAFTSQGQAIRAYQLGFLLRGQHIL